MDKIKQLENIAKVLGTYNVITKDEFNQVIKSVADVLKVERENIKGISEEYKQTLQSVIDTISEEHDKVLQSVENTSQTAKSEATEAITKALEEVKRVAKEVMEMKPKDGERGLDADEEIIVEKVLGKIVLPEYKETVLDGGEQIVDKINALDLSPENQIDASHIKNLPQPKMIGGGSTARNLYQLNDVSLSSPSNNQILKYNATTGLWVNGSGGGGSGVVETIVAGNNIDVDSTDPANPIVSVETLTLSDISDVTATAAEVNILSGATITTTELNYLGGVTSGVQAQINTKASKSFAIAMAVALG
jgi:regulator of sigma D